MTYNDEASKNKIIFSFSEFKDQSILLELDLKEVIQEKRVIQEMIIEDMWKEIILDRGLYAGEIKLSYRTKRPILFNYSAKTVFRFLNNSKELNSIKKNECQLYKYDPEDAEIVYHCPLLNLTQNEFNLKIKNHELKKIDTMWTGFIWGVALLGLFNTPPFYGFLAPSVAGVARFNNEIRLSD
ncbi:hypothetical protein [Leptospira santarosai]|uniref:hypothetical protein n=1 Tax=Leptospira santarosai TaxID=28183 RepID=UPI0012FDD961|nr:hypothetical protein [Leptospira santarosai]